jgi:hypothetical protein
VDVSNRGRKMKYCDYGCGKKAKFLFKNGKWCCSIKHCFCPVVRKRWAVRLYHKSWVSYGKEFEDEIWADDIIGYGVKGE